MFVNNFHGYLCKTYPTACGEGGGVVVTVVLQKKKIFTMET